MKSLIEEAFTVWRARSLVWVLTRREISARYAGSAGGIFWAYAQPLLMIAAYYLVFDVVFAMRLGEQAPTRAVGAYLIVGALPWMAFCDCVGRGMNSLLDAGDVLKKNPLPAVLFPVRSVLASAIVYAPLMLVLALGYGPSHQFSPALAVLPALLLLQLALCLSLGYLLAIAAAALRDTVQFVTFLFAVGIFLSPVLFPISMFPPDWRWVLWLNPMTALVMGYQEVLLKGQWPSASVWWVSLAWLGVICGTLNLMIVRSRDELLDWL
jgi:lipopolysaccharide transport system permease protein